jgi:hypothetical protein
VFLRLTVQDPPPTEVGMNPSFAQVLRNAIQIQKKQGDSHLAVDHILAALAEEKVLGHGGRGFLRNIIVIKYILYF